MKYAEIKPSVEQINSFLDQILKLNNLKNDAALSKALNVAPPMVSKMRHGRLPVGAAFVIKLEETFSLRLTQIKDMLLAPVDPEAA